MPHTVVPFDAESPGEKFNDEKIELSVRLEQKIVKNENFCSFELFSGRDTTDEIYKQLFSKLEVCRPLFYSITWHEAISKVTTEDHPSLKYFKKFPDIALLHLAARKLSRKNVMHVLNRAVKVGRANIFALQGDFSKLDQELNPSDFPHAIDLVKFIRAEFGTKFTICVAGYPEMHPRSPSKEADLFYLKEKVDAGANFIITQIIFESKVFIEFVKDCRRIGITVPIIPGVCLIPSYNSAINLSKNCETGIPPRILKDLELIKDDDAAVQEYGIKLSSLLVQEIFDSGTACGFHLFTLNKSQLALELCKRVGLCKV